MLVKSICHVDSHRDAVTNSHNKDWNILSAHIGRITNQITMKPHTGDLMEQSK